MSSTTPRAPTISDTSGDHDDDIAAIKAVIADIEAGFNSNDADLLNAHFAENGTAVSVTGVQLTGRAELLEASRIGLSGALREERARYELSDLVFLRADVAVGHKHARAIDASGELIDIDHTMIVLYVFVKEHGRWWVAARQNTLVPQH